jgi:hypothetical protein
LATKFTYKMRSGGKGMWGRGPALCKQNYLKKNKIIIFNCTVRTVYEPFRGDFGL